MRMYDIIQKKRNGIDLTVQEIDYFIDGYTNGRIPDYQAAALCMAIWFKGMTIEETTALTLAIRDSGERLDFSAIRGVRVDKHSTGGVGDKTSLVVAPLVASLGCRVAKMSGRGLGHTGGTIDKLEAIPGFQTDLPTQDFIKTVNAVGVAIVGQTAALAPADKMLYALRDVTATVDSMPLIASSIMGKKLAADDDCILLDVKTGSGAFMKTEQESRALASLMVDIGRRAGKKMCAMLTDMDRPLGHAIGNTLEVLEAIETLQGHGPADLTELCIALAGEMLHMAGHGDSTACYAAAAKALQNGSALQTFAEMVAAQGGNSDFIFHPEKFQRAPYAYTVMATQDGYITAVDCAGYGTAALLLGAGRNRKEDAIDHAAGIWLCAKTGDRVTTGQPIAHLYAATPHLFPAAAERLLAATVMGQEPPLNRPLILDIIT